jgi:23S rRNA pseudouridine2457 synthase
LNNYFIAYKPFHVLCQFTSEGDKKTLKDFFDVPRNIYPVGRLDYDSEGLIILTNDKKLNHLLLNPVHGHEREYWVQVEGLISHEAINKLINGIAINIDGKMFQTKKCKAEKFFETPLVRQRIPPIRFRKNLPDSWIKIILTEGKNRQVRKMTAGAGHPTLRLIRTRIESVTLAQLQPGEMKSVSQQELYKLLKIQKR